MNLDGRLPSVRAARLVGALALAMGVTLAPVFAADRVVEQNGSTHTVSVDAQTGTKLSYRLEASEEPVTVVIPGTDDLTPDSEPTILLSPLTQRPVIVWTLDEGANAEIAYSFYNGTTWSSATVLTQNTVGDFKPQISWGHSGYLHIMWSRATSSEGPVPYEAVLDSKGVVMLPPTPVNTVPGPIVTTTTSAPPSFALTDVLFLTDTSYKALGRVTAQGGYDEPIPVHKRVEFALPAGTHSVDHSKIEAVNGRILVLVQTGAQMFYSYQEPTTGWTPLRTVTLDATLDARGAEIMIKAMIEGLGEP